MRQRGGDETGVDNIPLYDAWGAAAAVFAGFAPGAFLGGITNDGYGLEGALMSFRTVYRTSSLEVVVEWEM